MNQSKGRMILSILQWTQITYEWPLQLLHYHKCGILHQQFLCVLWILIEPIGTMMGWFQASKLRFIEDKPKPISTIQRERMIFEDQRLPIDLFELGSKFWLFQPKMVKMRLNQQLRLSRWWSLLSIPSIIYIPCFDDSRTPRITMERSH